MNPQIIIEQVAAEFNITTNQLIQGKVTHCLNARVEATKRLYEAGFVIADIQRFLKRKSWYHIQYYLEKNGIFKRTYQIKKVRGNTKRQ